MTPLVLFGFVPKEDEVTTIVIVHPLDGKLGTFKFNVVAPTVSAGVLVTPTHVPAIVVEETLIFVNVSVNTALVRATAFGLVKVNVIVDVPPARMDAGLKDFEMVGFP